MWIKICANTNLNDARRAAELGADAVGFVFAPSKRQVTVEQVAAIVAELPPGVEKVGVFTTSGPADILDATSRSGLTMVQLHSRFDPALVESIAAADGGRLRVIQVLDVPAGSDPDGLRTELEKLLLHPQVAAVLLDASHGVASGGTGKTFDWAQTAATVRAVQQETGGKVIVAGGLRAENVAEAITLFEPWGVDVASGVESTPGTKDDQRLRAFLENAGRRPASH